MMIQRPDPVVPGAAQILPYAAPPRPVNVSNPYKESPNELTGSDGSWNDAERRSRVRADSTRGSCVLQPERHLQCYQWDMVSAAELFLQRLYCEFYTKFSNRVESITPFEPPHNHQTQVIR